MKLLKFLNIAIETCLLLSIGLSPIIFQCVTYNCWEINKFIFFQILLAITILIWLIKSISGLRIFNPHFKIILPAFIFLSVLILATVISDSPQFSFLGDYHRKMGLITWIHFFLFFLVLISEIRNQRQIERILIVILIASIPIVVYGILQFLGIDFIVWAYGGQLFLNPRIFSTFGQPNFFGSWLLLTIPVAVFSFFHFRNFYSRFFILLLIFSLFLCLILTLSRGAWIGFLAGIVFFGLIWLKLKNKKGVLVVFASLLVLISIFWFYLNLGQPPQKSISSPILNRLESLVFLKKAVTGYTRLMAWQTAFDLIKQRPILGYGPEMFGFYTVKYYQPINAVYEAINSYPDRAHNDFLDTLLNAGIIGLVAYLFLIGSVFYYGFKSLKSEHPRVQALKRLTLALLIGFFSHLASLQFSFHTLQTAVYFWLYIALIYIISTNLKINSSVPLVNPLKLDIKRVSMVILLILVTGFFIWQFSIKVLLADWYYKKSLLFLRQQKIEQGLASYAKVFFLQPEEIFYRQRFAKSLFGLASSVNNQEKKIEILNLAIGAIDDIPSGAQSFEDKAYQAKILASKAEASQKKEDFEIADQSFQKLAALSPKMAGIYNDWCQLKIYEKNWDQALIKCQNALDLYPDLKHPYLNEIHRQLIIAEMIQVYEKLCQIYLQKRDYEKVLENYWAILRLNPFQYHIYKKIADIYYIKKDLNSAIKYNLRGSILNPNDYAWPWSIALLYYEKGDLKSARQYAEQALKLNPDNQQIKQFLKRGK